MLKLLCLGAALTLSSLSIASYPISDHYNGSEFFNPGGNKLHSFFEIMKWKLSGTASPWPAKVVNKTYDFKSIQSDQKAVVTFINHGTFLIQLKNLNILTDPIYSDRASPVSFAGPVRVREPGIQFDKLPRIDVVIISHNHYDHLDLDTLKKIKNKFNPLFLVPLGDMKLLKSEGIKNVQEMDWWQNIDVKGVGITFAPAQHWSARGLFDKCESLWGSYFVLSQEFKFYFAGDTGLGPHFKNIRNRLGIPDLALLPIGAYDPPHIMQHHHMNPEEAIQAHQDLESKFSIGMHFGTFQLTDEAYDEPMKRLENEKQKKNILNFWFLDQGDSKTF
jgi:L-ascorbate metabolism protein UlaG (beta-lactamase superfamily)